jgi:hypothetical protein
MFNVSVADQTQITISAIPFLGENIDSDTWYSTHKFNATEVPL